MLDAVADEERVAGLGVMASAGDYTTRRVVDADHVQVGHVVVLQPLAQTHTVHLVTRAQQRLEHATRSVGVHGDLGVSGVELVVRWCDSA